MVRAARYAYVALAWAFVAGIVVQVFFIGLALFVKPQSFDLHVNFGWLLHLGPLPVLVAAALARAGRTRILQATALTVTIFFVPILAGVRADLPFLAAFHPVGALLGFWLAIVVARGATSLARTTTAEARTTRGEWVLVALVVLVVLFLSLSGGPSG
jgi:hypothetical protein